MNFDANGVLINMTYFVEGGTKAYQITSGILSIEKPSPQQLFYFNDKSYDRQQQANLPKLQQRYNIFIGDVSSATDYQLHQKQSIKTIITTDKRLEHLKVPKEVKHIVYLMLDQQFENIDFMFKKFYQLVENSLRRGSILVNCTTGISRSPTLVISYLMKKDKMKFTQAFTYLQRYIKKIRLNKEFQKHLKLLELIIIDPQSHEKHHRTKTVDINPIKSNHTSSQFQLSKRTFHKKRFSINNRVSQTKFQTRTVSKRQVVIYKVYNKGNKKDFHQRDLRNETGDNFIIKNLLSKTHKNIVLQRFSTDYTDKSKDKLVLTYENPYLMSKWRKGGSNKMKKFNQRLRERFAKGWGKSYEQQCQSELENEK